MRPPSRRCRTVGRDRCGTNAAFANVRVVERDGRPWLHIVKVGFAMGADGKPSDVPQSFRQRLFSLSAAETKSPVLSKPAWSLYDVCVCG